MNSTVAPHEFEPADLWWNGGDAFRSRLFDAISLLLPSGESFVITALSDWLSADRQSGSTSLHLRREVQRFVHEEQSHSRAHQLYNERLQAHAPARELERRVERVVQDIKGWSLPNRLAMASAFEHLTAMLSQEILRKGSAWLSAGHARQTRLWRWHCQEELDHYHVAKQAMLRAGVGPARRNAALIAAVLFLLTDVLGILRALLRADREAGRVGAWQLACECATFSVSVLPSVLRMAWGCCRYAVSNR